MCHSRSIERAKDEHTMYENLYLVTEHHMRDLKREAENARLAAQALAAPRPGKRAHRAIISVLTNSLHPR
jgi:hypothetical protein